MTAAADNPSVEVLYQKWKAFLDQGRMTTASHLAADYPELIGPLQGLIQKHLTKSGEDYDRTLTYGGTTRDDDLAPPDIRGYAVEKQLGVGGMGVVWQVRDELGRTWALKIARADRLSEAGRARFYEEMKRMAQLEHPNIAKIHHYGWHDGAPYFLMPVYPYSLKDKLDEYKADPKKALRLMAKVAEGVGHMHSKGLVHRDLKPGNILIDEKGNPCVSDFGLVKALGEEPSSVSDVGEAVSDSRETKPTGAKRAETRVGAVLGTKAYMHPDQAAGLTHLANPRWDVWAMGVMLQEVIARSSNSESFLTKVDPGLSTAVLSQAQLDKLGREVRVVINKLRSPTSGLDNGIAVATCIFKSLHRPYWRRVCICVILLLVTLPIAILLFRERTPLTPLEKVVAEFAKGSDVQIIGEAGWPVWYQVSVGDDIVKPYLSERDNAFVVDSSRLVLVEMPHPKKERYRSEVEIEQLDEHANTRIGVYSGHHRQRTIRGDEVDCFAAIWLNDRNPVRKAQRANVTPALRSYARRVGHGGTLAGCEFEPR